jgi:heterodisulfide reductase subunit C
MAKKMIITSDNETFVQKITELSGETVTLCEQCGTCSGGCPMVGEMDITPSHLMKMSQLGIRDVLQSKTIWVCASCYTCTIRCPRGLDVSKVAEALRQMILRQAIDHIDIRAIPKEELEQLPQIAMVSACRKFTG